MTKIFLFNTSKIFTLIHVLVMAVLNTVLDALQQSITLQIVATLCAALLVGHATLFLSSDIWKAKPA